jgi:hypothetical protein
MDFVLIKIDSKTWEDVWEWLSSHPINEGIKEPSIALNEGCTWEYRGTYKKGNKGVTEFIHRNHPKTNCLFKLSYSHEILDTDIEKKFKV